MFNCFSYQYFSPFVFVKLKGKLHNIMVPTESATDCIDTDNRCDMING